MARKTQRFGPPNQPQVVRLRISNGFADRLFWLQIVRGSVVRDFFQFLV
jgi:hypothetical protein